MMMAITRSVFALISPGSVEITGLPTAFHTVLRRTKFELIPWFFEAGSHFSSGGTPPTSVGTL